MDDVDLALAKVGILALIDEATGYQDIRAENELAVKFEDFMPGDDGD